MKKLILKNIRTSAAIAACLLTGSIILMSFSLQDTPFVNQILNQQPADTDTLPEKRVEGSMKMKDLDNLINNLNDQMPGMENGMKDLDMDLIQQQTMLSLKQIDIAAMVKAVDEALKNINIDKIMAEVAASLTNINWNNQHREIQQAMQEARGDMEKAKEEIEKIDMKEIKADLEKARRELKNINAEEIRRELQEVRVELEKNKAEFSKSHIKEIMQDAKKSVQEAKVELQQVKNMFIEMEADGLIHARDGFSIEYKDKELYINGVKQKEPVTDKYRKYFTEDHFQIKIEKE